VAFARRRCHPVTLLARGRFLPEVDVGGSVGVLRGLITGTERGEGWPLARPDAVSAS
jgi:hypothetical protein